MSNNKKEILELVKKYEETLASSKSVYFDADQFGDIADHYDREGEIDSARELLEIALKIHPENDLLLLKKAKLLVYDGEYDEALHLLDIAFSGYDFDYYAVKIECLLQLNRHNEAADLVEVILQNEDSQDTHSTLADIGFLYLEADCFDEAIGFFEESIKLDENNVEVLIDLAYAYEMIGEFEDAITTTNKVLDIDAYNYDAWINLGKLYSMEEDYEKAVDAFDFALTINDNDINILKLKAHCLSLSGRAMDAMLIFRDILKKDAKDTTLYLLLCECYASLELFAEAQECLEQYRTAEGDALELALKEAALFFQMNKHAQALTMIDKAMETYGTQLDLLTLSGDIKSSIEDYEGAIADYKSAYQVESDNFEVIDKLAITAIKLEDYIESIRYTEELLSLEPDNEFIKQRLALLYFEIDDEQNFNNTLDQFDEEQLMDLFKLFYEPQQPELFDRALLIASLNEARQYRTLFKNLKY